MGNTFPLKTEGDIPGPDMVAKSTASSVARKSSRGKEKMC